MTGDDDERFADAEGEDGGVCVGGPEGACGAETGSAGCTPPSPPGSIDEDLAGLIEEAVSKERQSLEALLAEAGVDAEEGSGGADSSQHDVQMHLLAEAVGMYRGLVRSDIERNRPEHLKLVCEVCGVQPPIISYANRYGIRAAHDLFGRR